MAQAAGNPTIFPMDAYGYWETAGLPASTIITDKGFIVSGYTDDGAGSEHYRAVLRMNGILSLWHDTVVTGGGVFIYIGKLAAEPLITGTSLDIQAGRLNGVWSASSTIAAMNTLWAAVTWVSGITLQVNAPGWYFLRYNPLWAQQALSYGIAIRVRSTSNGTIFVATEEAGVPQLRTYYPCDYPSASGYATVDRRGTLSKAVKAELLKLKPQWFGRLTVIANLNKADSTLTDYDLSESLSLSSVGDWNNREINIPESWNLEFNKPGGMTLAVTDDLKIRSLVGAEVDMSFLLDDGSGTSEQVSGGKVRFKRVGRGVDGRIDCGLDDVHSAIRDSGAYIHSSIEGIYVSYTSVQILELLYDMLVNSPRRLRTGYWTTSQDVEAGIYPGDWYWLYQRFMAVWPRLDISTAYAEDSSVTKLASLTGRLYGLFSGTGHDGRILCFHPAVYRPSMRVWYINIDEAAAEGKANIKNVVPFATALTVDDPDQPILVRGRTPLANIEMGDKVENIPMDTDLFEGHTRKAIKYAHLHQLTYRYTDEAKEMNLVTNHQGLPWMQGDVLFITSEIYSISDEPYLLLIKEGGPADSEVKVVAYHWPYWEGAFSLFAEDTPRGIWRWADAAHVYSGDSSAWGANATAVAFAINTGVPEFVFEEWGGALIQDSTANYTELQASLSISSASKQVDVLELPVGVKGIPYNFTVGNTFKDWWVMQWKEAATSRALCVFIRREPFIGSPKDGCSEKSMWGLGYTQNYAANPIVWDWSILSPPGVGYDGGAGGTNWDLDYLTVALSATQATFYIDGKEVGSYAWTRNTNLAHLKVRCSGNYKSMFGRLRCLLLDNRMPEERELVAENGQDPFYP